MKFCKAFRIFICPGSRKLFRLYCRFNVMAKVSNPRLYISQCNKKKCRIDKKTKKLGLYLFVAIIFLKLANGLQWFWNSTSKALGHISQVSSNINYLLSEVSLCIELTSPSGIPKKSLVSNNNSVLAHLYRIIPLDNVDLISNVLSRFLNTVNF
jgi:hypothetical protein